MSTLQLPGCLHPEGHALERVNYFPRQLLTVDDMETERDYFLEKSRRHNLFLHGWGVVCGLEVTAAPTPAMPWLVKISPGYALGPYGDEIYVAEPVCLDLAQCGPGAVTDPCEPGFVHPGRSGTGGQLYIAIKYAECLARPVRAMPAGCACEEEACEYSRIRDSFQIECLGELPPSHQPPLGRSLCDLLEHRLLPSCPPCPTDPWVVLAHVTVPASPPTRIAPSKIDNFTFRRLVFSTAVLQEQLIKCCCKPEEPPVPTPARVLAIDPPNGMLFRPTIGGGGDTPPSHIVITFTKNLLAETVNAQTIQVMMFPDNGQPNALVAGTVTYNDTAKSAAFTPNQPFTSGVATGFRYGVTVRGDIPNAVLDVDTLALDGDGYGSPGYGLPGGNFISEFTIQLGAS